MIWSMAQLEGAQMRIFWGRLPIWETFSGTSLTWSVLAADWNTLVWS